jgi:hypothetical protein
MSQKDETRKRICEPSASAHDFHRFREGQGVHDRPAIILDVDALVKLDLTAQGVVADDGTGVGQSGLRDRAHSVQLTSFRIEKDILAIAQVEII